MKQYDVIIIRIRQRRKDAGCRVGKTEAGRCRSGAFGKRCTEGVCINIGCIPTKHWCMRQSRRTKTLLGRSRRHTIVSPLQGRKRVVSFLRQKNYLKSGPTIPHITVYGYWLLCRSGCGGSWDGGRDITIASSPDIHQYGCRNRHSTDRGDTR